MNEGPPDLDPSDAVTRDDDPIARLEHRLGYRFTNRGVLLEALTHRSFVNETQDQNVRDNERMEFLGDAVIDLVVSAALMTRFPDAREGSLSRIRASLVSETGLAELAAEIDLGSALRLGRGEELSGGRERASLLADAFEALLAAVYVDGGFEATRHVLLPKLKLPEVEQQRPGGDPKTELQEHLQATLHVTPSYRVVSEDGPDHSKTFVVEIVCDGEVLGRGAGRTKKEAEQRAAATVLSGLPRVPPG